MCSYRKAKFISVISNSWDTGKREEKLTMDYGTPKHEFSPNLPPAAKWPKGDN